VSGDRWSRLEELFAAARARPASERAAFLASTCPGEPDICREVLSLLAADDSAGSFLGVLSKEKSAALLAEGDTLLAGRRIGVYRLIRELGRGGMGLVYLAERADGQFEQQVALKLIKRGMDSDEIQRRFLLERQILARLQHPNIARLLDGGVSDDGSPYFAMEYIAGIPLLAYCDAKRLDVDARLALFRQVGEAVQYAHQQLIVHRDLKPSNILVTESGEPKLLDFGIAKVLDTEEGRDLPGLTRTGARPMTPAYGAPEQIRGDAVTTATDTYTLGVILYELLAGRFPYRVDTATPEAFAAAITDSDAERLVSALRRPPARRGEQETDAIAAARGTTGPRLRRRLQGDLDTIVRKALCKEPERRYASVEALLDDLDRHRTGLPVRARPDTLAYRSSRFLRRHALGVTAAALIVLSLIAGLSIAVWQAGVASREADKANEVRTFLVEMFEEADPSRTRGEQVTVREILDRGADRIERELAGQLEIRAELMELIGTLYGTLGLYDRAQALLRESLALRRGLYGDRHAEVAGSLNELGGILRETGDYDGAEPLFRESIAICRPLREGACPKHEMTLSNLGLLLSEIGRYEEAEPLFAEALESCRSQFGPESEETSLTLHNYAQHLKWKGDFKQAEALYREALDLRLKIHGEDHNSATTMSNLGVMLAQNDQVEEGEVLIRRALDIRRRVLGDDHPDTSLNINNMGMLYYVTGRYDEAERYLGEALAINRRIFGEEHQRVAVNIGNLALIAMKRGDFETAVDLQEKALAIRRKNLGDRHPDVSLGLTGLSNALLLAGQPQRAESTAAEALEIEDTIHDADHPRRAASLLSLARARLDLGRLDMAEAAAREAATILDKLMPQGSWRAAEASAVLGECLWRLGRSDEAEPLLDESYESLREARGEDDQNTERARRALAAIRRGPA
jgi:serine/threonine-protein kinase